MKFYRLTWTQGNGYRCGCCRRTWSEYEDFDNLEEAQEKIERLKRIRNSPTPEEKQFDEDDFSDLVLLTILEAEGIKL